MTVANDKYFSTCLTDQSGLDKLSVFSDYTVKRNAYKQNNGVCYDADYVFTDRYLNLAHDKEAVLKFVNAAFTKRFITPANEEKDEIASLERQILMLQSQVQTIKDGKRPMRLKPEFIEREFLRSNSDTTLKIINSE